MTLSFDIETVARTDLDDETIAALVKGKTEEEARGILDRLALSPFTGRVVVIAMWDDEKDTGICLANDGLAVAELPEGFVLATYADERALLTHFWAMASKRRRFATFNGSGFDVPFLVGRSLALDVTIHRPLIETKPWEDLHVDLMQKLSAGSRNRPSFDIVCRALGVPSPKTGGIEGSEVGAAWADGRRAEVAAYCCRDVRALVDCLAKWDRYALGRREPERAAA